MSEPALLLLGTIISALISASVAVGGLWLGRRERAATTQKLETETERARRETEEIIWKRARAEIDDLRRELIEERLARKSLEAELSNERILRQQLTTRVNELERLNGLLDAENKQLRDNHLGEK